MQTLRQLVTGTDFSACAGQAVALAVKLARAARAGVTVVHVCEPDEDDRRLQQRTRALASLVRSHRRAGVAIRGVLRCGDPCKKLDNVAVEVGADLIVIGRHGEGRSAGLGSVADQLVRCANRSVLTVTTDPTDPST